ncbi:MAG TPA: hypothetical protein VGI58_01155 [Streptosporangiaceae bacterium]
MTSRTTPARAAPGRGVATIALIQGRARLAQPDTGQKPAAAQRPTTAPASQSTQIRAWAAAVGRMAAAMIPVKARTAGTVPSQQTVPRRMTVATGRDTRSGVADTGQALPCLGERASRAVTGQRVRRHAQAGADAPPATAASGRAASQKALGRKRSGAAVPAAVHPTRASLPMASVGPGQHGREPGRRTATLALTSVGRRMDITPAVTDLAMATTAGMTPIAVDVVAAMATPAATLTQIATVIPVATLTQTGTVARTAVVTQTVTGIPPRGLHRARMPTRVVAATATATQTAVGIQAARVIPGGTGTSTAAAIPTVTGTLTAAATPITGATLTTEGSRSRPAIATLTV